MLAHCYVSSTPRKQCVSFPMFPGEHPLNTLNSAHKRLLLTHQMCSLLSCLKVFPHKGSFARDVLLISLSVTSFFLVPHSTQPVTFWSCISVSFLILSPLMFMAGLRCKVYMLKSVSTIQQAVKAI